MAKRVVAVEGRGPPRPSAAEAGGATPVSNKTDNARENVRVMAIYFVAATTQRKVTVMLLPVLISMAVGGVTP